MKKTSKQYAEKLAKNITNTESTTATVMQMLWTEGYLKAISENNVEELIEALGKAIKREKAFPCPMCGGTEKEPRGAIPYGDIESPDWEQCQYCWEIDEAEQSLKKAKS